MNSSSKSKQGAKHPGSPGDADAPAKVIRAKPLFDISHEFRAPLISLLSALEEVLPEARGWLSRRHYDQLKGARRNALRLLKLVNALLDFSRIEQGRAQAGDRPSDLASLTTEIASVFRLPQESGAAVANVSCEITEREARLQAEAESERRKLRLSQERLQAALTASGTGTFCWNPHTGEFLECDENLKRLFGFEPQDPVITQEFVSRVHPEDRPRLIPAVNACLDGGDFEMEFRVVLPDGSVRWLYDRAKMEWENGRPTYLVGACTDITSRKQVEEVRFRLAAIVESSDDAIVSKDLNGIVTSWNRAAESMFGYTAQEMIGRSITTIIPPELQDDERRILKTIGRGERIEHFETVRVTRGGERIEVSLTISPVRNEAGVIIGAAKIARDIAQQRKAERALRTTEKLASVGRLAATVAHEINNPLEAVTNLVYLAKHKAVRQDVRNYLRVAEEELDRVSQLTKQTLGFYRETKSISAIKISAIVNPLISVFASRMRNKGIEIRPEIRQEPEICVVPGEIRQLVANLLSNSIDAVHAGGCIRIRVAGGTAWNGQRRPGIRLTIADSGPGIPAAIRSKLFEPFFTTKKEFGTGLGLWVCKSIVEKHCGSIRVKSSTIPGRSWTVFSVFLSSLQQESAEQDLKQAV